MRFVKNFTQPGFQPKILHTKSACIATIKQYNCINIRNLGPFLFNYTKYVKIQQFKSKITLVHLCKLCKKKCCSPENLHSWHKFYTTAGRDGRDKSQLWGYPVVPIRYTCSQQMSPVIAFIKHYRLHIAVVAQKVKVQC